MMLYYVLFCYIILITLCYVTLHYIILHYIILRCVCACVLVLVLVLVHAATFFSDWLRSHHVRNSPNVPAEPSLRIP